MESTVMTTLQVVGTIYAVIGMCAFIGGIITECQRWQEPVYAAIHPDSRTWKNVTHHWVMTIFLLILVGVLWLPVILAD